MDVEMRQSTTRASQRRALDLSCLKVYQYTEYSIYHHKSLYDIYIISI